MALISCPECGGRLSTAALSCPHCGRPTTNEPKLPRKPAPVPLPAGLCDRVEPKKNSAAGFLLLGACLLLLAVAARNCSKALSETPAPAQSAEKSAVKAAPKPPPGWFETGVSGVLMAFCKADEKAPECLAAGERSGGPALVIKVWCRDRPCGDIYIQANQATDQGAVMGWTNDTGNGRQGDVVYLALRYYSEGGVFASPKVTEFRIGGEEAQTW